MPAAVQLLYDPRDDPHHERVGSQILYWMDDLDAVPLPECDPTSPGFLFAGHRGVVDYRDLVAPYPLVRDRPEQREPLVWLDAVLAALAAAGVVVPMPRTWVLPLDAPLPADLAFPLFVRTAESSWRRGGHVSRVETRGELAAEAAELRRVLGWDATVLAREWLDLEPAGDGHHGPVPQEVRVWVVDGEPIAWSFHHLQLVRNPRGFPPQTADLAALRRLGRAVGSAFRSRLVAADFARDRAGTWWLIEAGPGSCAGTAHERMFKAVARRLRGETDGFTGDAVGGVW